MELEVKIYLKTKIIKNKELKIAILNSEFIDVGITKTMNRSMWFLFLIIDSLFIFSNLDLNKTTIPNKNTITKKSKCKYPVKNGIGTIWVNNDVIKCKVLFIILSIIFKSVRWDWLDPLDKLRPEIIKKQTWIIK